MFLKRFKEKSNKKYLNAILKTRSTDVNDSKIGSLGVIFCIDEIDDFEAFRALATSIHVRPNKLKVIAYTENIKDAPFFWDTCFHSKDFGWNGKIKNIELQSFLDTKFDALISYYKKDILELKLLTASSKSKFKIGTFQTDERLNDFIIKTPLEAFKTFKTELIKYLTILNKIKK